MSIRYLLLFVPVLWFASCDNKNNSFTLKGNINNMPAQVVVLEELGINEVKIIDSAKSDENGKFEIKGNTLEANLYRLRFSGDAGKFILLSFDKGKIGITGDWNNLAETYDFTGSPSSSALRKLIFTYRQHLKDYNTLCIIIDSMKARNNDSMLARAQTELKDINFQFTRFIETYSDTASALPNALCAVELLNPATEKEYLSVFQQTLNKRFPKSQLAKDYSEKIQKLLKGQAAKEEDENGIAVGEIAPEITSKTADGKTVKLSEMRGKYVLVDFWASWCPPCRAENPNVVAAWGKFNTKNFAILGFSLDETKDKWLEAVEKDHLSWTQVCDFQRWESLPVRNYKVNAIPANFLLDPQGKIIAKNLHGEELEQKLTEVLK